MTPLNTKRLYVYPLTSITNWVTDFFGAHQRCRRINTTVTEQYPVHLSEKVKTEDMFLSFELNFESIHALFQTCVTCAYAHNSGNKSGQAVFIKL